MNQNLQQTLPINAFLNSLFLLGIVFAFSFTSYSQSISIGSPVDGTEGATFVSFIVSLDGGIINATGSPITGSISYTGTATPALDYNDVSTFSIPNGASSTFVILMVIDDTFVECDETVIATLSTVSVGTIGTATSTAIIIDDECPTSYVISIGFPVDGAEGGADVSFDMFIEGGGLNTTGAPIVGTISYAGTASAADFTGIPPSFFDIPNGANSTTITLPVFDDAIVECDETVITTISTLSVGTIGNSTSTAIIVDNECLQPTISIGTPVDGEEGGSDVSYVISLDGGLVNGTGAAITGDVNFTGTASGAGVDFADNPMFSIPDGASFVVHEVVVNDDLIIEPTESVIATISNPSVGFISNAVDTAYIIDNDSTTSIDPISVLDVRIYPNPMNSTLNFEAERQMKSYSMVDINGRVVSEGEINSKEFNLKTDFLSAGSYVISVRFEDGSKAIKKILKD